MTKEPTNEKEYKTLSLKNIGVDLSNLDYTPNSAENEYEYVLTSVSANNDFLIKDYITKSNRVMVDLDCVGADTTYMLTNHMYQLGINNIEVLFIDSKTDWKDEKLQEYLSVNCKIGIKNPETVEELENANSVINFSHILIDICPLNFNYDVITWAKKHDKIIVGSNIFGGNLAASEIIRSFTVPYLLTFAANYCDVVLLSSRNLYYSESEREFLTKLIGTEASPIVNITKNIIKLPKNLKVAINQSLKLRDDLIIPIEGTGLFFDTDETILTPGKKVLILPEEVTVHQERESDDIIDEAYSYSTSTNLIGSDEHKLASLRYGIMDILKAKLNETYYFEINQVKLCDNVIIFNVNFDIVTRSGLFSIEKNRTTKMYFMFYKDSQFIFTELGPSASEDPQNS